MKDETVEARLQEVALGSREEKKISIIKESYWSFSVFGLGEGSRNVRFSVKTTTGGVPLHHSKEGGVD